MRTDSLATRLKEERKRLKMTQVQIAKMVSIARETWSRYEAGKMFPGSEVMLGLVKLKVDVNYVFTGKRAVDLDDVEITCSKVTTAEQHGAYNVSLQLTKKELELIKYYRKIDEESKKSIEGIAKLYATQQVTPKK